MSVAIIISEPLDAPGDRFYVPVAAQETFDTYWYPAAEALGLHWMPVFSFGVSVTRADMPEVRQEFVLMRDWFDNNIEDRELADFLKGRAELSIAGIDEVLARDDVGEIFIG